MVQYCFLFVDNDKDLCARYLCKNGCALAKCIKGFGGFTKCLVTVPIAMHSWTALCKVP